MKCHFLDSEIYSESMTITWHYVRQWAKTQNPWAQEPQNESWSGLIYYPSFYLENLCFLSTTLDSLDSSGMRFFSMGGVDEFQMNQGIQDFECLDPYFSMPWG